MNVVTRIAPSPTGMMHIGTVRTALFNYLFAKQHNGTYFVRIEDTDKERNRPEWVDAIWKDFEWVGLTPDKSYVQSEHVLRHKELLHTLVEEDKAYISNEPAKDDPMKTVSVVRLRNPGTSITFPDLVRGDVTFDTKELGDFVIARSIDDPLYHFAVVVDDHEAGVTHVIRAEEHLSNTPRQILIQRALGFSEPLYAHIPLILAPDRSKLSKRKHNASLESYRDEGFMPEAVLNYLALLGWSPEGDREDFSLDELIQEFDLSRVHKSGAIFDRVKFLSVNQRWMRKLSPEEFVRRGNLSAPDETMLIKIVPLLQERAQTFSEAKAFISGEFLCLFEPPVLDLKTLINKEPKEAPGFTKEALKDLLEALKGLQEGVSSEVVKDTVMPYADQKGRGAVLWPLRYALSGKEKSPDPFTLVSLLGVPESLSRIEKAITLL